MTHKEKYELAKWNWIVKEHPCAFKKDPVSFERGFKELCKFPRISGAPSLEKTIANYMKYVGHQCSKITTSGRYVAGKKTIGTSSSFGTTQSANTGHYIPGGSTKGVADLIATVYGLKWDIEVKFSKGDKQRDTQIEYQKTVENAGGFYSIVKTFQDFIEKYEEFIELPRVKLMREFNID